MDREDLLKKFYDLGLDIIRLKPDDKRPAEKWGESDRHSFETLRRFQKFGANFGAALGDRSNGIVVIDLDQPELYHKYFRDIDTLVVKTPKKGYHLYLQTDKEQRKIPSYLFKPIDLQANKTYVVIPPSQIGGNSYEVIKDKPILKVKDPEEFLSKQLEELSFKKTVDCKDLAREELGEPNNDFGHYTQYHCPFHPDGDTPSLTVYEDGFKCFGCDWSGSAQDFLLKLGKEPDEVFEYLDEHGVEIEEDIKLQTKRQKQLQLLCGLVQSKYPMVTEVKTSKAYIYFSPRNAWREIYGDTFFKQLVYETTGHPILDDEVDILVQYIFNPQVEATEWIAFNNGLVNIETGEFRQPTSDIFTTFHLNYNYNQKAYSETFDNALKDILIDDKDGEKKYEFFFEMCGYFFTGDNKYNKMFFLTGTGANGKSTLMAIIRKIFEGYTSSQQLQNLHKDFGLQPLVGKKINIVYDLSASALTDIGTLKAITGEDEVTINIKNKPQITMKLPTKIIATGNVLPKVNEDTYAFYRRVVHLELINTFTNPDINLPQKLVEDVEGMEWFIAKSINSYKNVKTDGWSIQEDIESVADTYKRVADPISWATEQLIENGKDDDFVSSENVYQAIKELLEESGMPVPKRSNKYYDPLREMGAEPTRRTLDGKQQRVWMGMRFKFLSKDILEMKGWE